MKKKYVFITFAITRMGGAQMYLNNKIQFLKRKGWDTIVFSAIDGPVIINNLKEYSGYVYRELRIAPDIYTEKKVNKILNEFSGIIEKADEIIIESNNPICSMWGEILAKKIQAKHFSFLLDENFSVDNAYEDYFRFKLKRGELAFINDKSASLLLGKTNGYNDGKKNVLCAVCNNVVEDIIDERFEKIIYNTDFVLCSLGRLTKGYMRNAIDGIADFLQENPEINMTCVFIGDEVNTLKTGIKEYIGSMIGTKHNASLYVMGSVYPIPKSFMNHVDIGIASAGSARVLDRYGIPTITMDAIDNEPIGVLGYTTKNALYRENEEKFHLSELLKSILIDNCLKKTPHSPSEQYDAEELFSKHMEFIEKSSRETRYYPVIDNKTISVKISIKRFLLFVLGTNNYIRCFFDRRSGLAYTFSRQRHHLMIFKSNR